MTGGRLAAGVAVAGAVLVAGAGSALAKPTVRPGMAVNIALASAPANPCTLGFLFTGRTGPRGRKVRYASTAGHCMFVDQTSTEEVHPAADGPEVHLTVRAADGTVGPGPRIGRAVYAAQTVPPLFANADLPEYMDLGLIALDRGVRAEPALCQFGGPTGLRSDRVLVPETMRFYGAGNFTGLNRETGTTLLPGRTGVGSASGHPNMVVGSFALSGGDSGAPFIDAAGRAVALGTGPYQSRLAPGIERAESVLGTRLKLRRAPLVPDAPPVGSDPACGP